MIEKILYFSNIVYEKFYQIESKQNDSNLVKIIEAEKERVRQEHIKLEENQDDQIEEEEEEEQDERLSPEEIKIN